MPFALLQSRLELPDIEALRRAFRGVGGMAPADAPGVARDGFGILLRRLAFEDATALQSALAREGVGTDIVDERHLPAVPPQKILRRVAYRLDAFVGYDPYDRELTIPWDRIAVAAVGNIDNSQILLVDSAAFSKPAPLPAFATVLDSVLGAGLPGPSDDSSTRPAPSSSQSPGWVADFILQGGELRFTLSARQLMIVGLGDRDRGDRLTNFFTLVRDSLLQLPGALLNRGAFALREEHLDPLLEGAPECPHYPTRNAYHEELTWLLWRLQRRS